MAQKSRRLTPEERSFRRKISWSRFALYFERLWPRLWTVITIAALFLLISLFGVWPLLSEIAHWSVLGAFGVALALAAAFVLSTPLPTRDEAIHRLEVRSPVHHRPASAFEDTLSSAPPEGVTAAIWNVHRDRVRKDLERLHVSPPVPRTDKFDRIGLRAVLVTCVVALLVLVGDAARDRVWSAFRLVSIGEVAGLRLDAWVTPPPYTRRPPILVADGSTSINLIEPEAAAVPIEVPEKSAIVVRMGGKSDVELTLEFIGADGQVRGEPVTEADSAKAAGEKKATSQTTGNQIKGILEVGTTAARLKANGAELASWSFNVIPDTAPRIAFTKDLEKTRRGAMKLFYRIEDDYGIASAEATFERLPLEPGDPKTSWARPEVLKGARPPLERPPKIVLRVPPPGAKKPETWSFHELGSHPWAGMPVRMTLVARDHAGNIGKSKAKDIVLPERLFFNPLARAGLEQRRRLVFDPRYRGLVVRALDALTLHPQDTIKDKAAYLGLRSVRHRLRADPGRKAIASSIEQLWHLALRIENGGGLSEAERRLREIQEKLAKAIERGASQKEIAELMRQLRQALAQFLNELAKQAQRQPPNNQQQNLDPNQMMSSQDLQRMLDNLEKMLRQGSKQSAQEMLSQLRDLLDRLQSGRMARQQQGQGNRSRQMMQMMDQLGDLIGRQQRLMDDTFGAQRQGQQGQQRQQEGRRGRQGQQGGRGQQNRRQGRSGSGQTGRGQDGQQMSPDGLGRRQGELGRRLDSLRRGLGQFGLAPSKELDGARRSMENAERALRNGQLGEATEEQSRALEQLRSGTNQMAEQMLRQMPNRLGRSGDAPLDPLGRPQRSEGPDLGTSVKVPDEIDAQRAREILELLRKRLGERFRPELELEYIERLLRRF